MDKSDDTKRLGFVLRLRNYFATGLLVLTPSVVTIWIMTRFFRWFDSILGKWYARLFEAMPGDLNYYPGLGALTLAIIIIMTGYIARQYAGRKLLTLWEKMINYVPLINRIYLAVRQISDSFAHGGGLIFQRPVMVQYPRLGVHSIGFVTRDCEGAFCTLIGEDVSSIFIPTTPNPTSGVVIFVKRSELIPLDMTVEDAMKLVISAGKVTPDIKLPAPKE